MRRSRPLGALILCALAVTQAAGAAAADRREATAVPLPPVPVPVLRDAPLPPYQGRLDRLAELMGTLSYLRDLCGNGDGAVWRGRMEALLASEGTSPARRDRLAGSFNRGFGDYRLNYRSCTPTAEVVIARALNEGVKLAGSVSAQFGTP